MPPRIDTQRVTARGFSLEVPCGQGWRVEVRDDHIDLDRPKMWMWLTVGRTFIRVARHELRPESLGGDAEISGFLDAEEKGLTVGPAESREFSRGSRQVHGAKYRWMSYRIVRRETLSNGPSVEMVWTTEGLFNVRRSQAFPGRSIIFSFHISETWGGGPWEALSDRELFDALISSFREDSLPAERAAAARASLNGR